MMSYQTERFIKILLAIVCTIILIILMATIPLVVIGSIIFIFITWLCYIMIDHFFF